MTSVLEKWIFKDKQLVLLATEKPIDKDSYFKVLNTDKGWGDFVRKIVD